MSHLALPQQQWVYVKRPEGDEPIGESHYEYRESVASLPAELNDGDVFVEALYLTVDPYMRIQQSASNTWEAPHPLGMEKLGEKIPSIH
jgi:NADPH-dependent curcumin reductase CurA